MFHFVYFLLALTTSLTLAAAPSALAEQTCGIGSQVCSIEQGNYNIELPERADPNSKIPAMIYFHGAGGTGARVLKNRVMVETFLDRGYAVIAPTGLKRPNSKWGPLWSFHPERPKQRNELTFTKALLVDATKRFNLDRDAILMSGFSIGGSLAWYLACEDPSVAKAYAPVGGAFWRPHPVATDCSGPVDLLHTHGWRDGTVPLEGRILRSGLLAQGDVFHSLDILRQVNGCDNHKADRFETSGTFWKRWWVKCKSGSTLQFNLFDGGHSVPEGWATQAIDWFERLDTPTGG